MTGANLIRTPATALFHPITPLCNTAPVRPDDEQRHVLVGNIMFISGWERAAGAKSGEGKPCRYCGQFEANAEMAVRRCNVQRRAWCAATLAANLSTQTQVRTAVRPLNSPVLSLGMIRVFPALTYTLETKGFSLVPNPIYDP
jgi:hypothetical protein